MLGAMDRLALTVLLFAIAVALLRNPSVETVPSASIASPQPVPASSRPDDDLVGKPAPDFTAAAHDGTSVHLAALKGKPVVLYFYPKDETPGCTTEANSFRESWPAIAAARAVVVGISGDSLDSHKRFASHHQLPFLLVSDPEGSIGRAFGVPFAAVHRRQTIIIGPDGVVRRVYRSVDVANHAEQVLADLASLT
jgi:peroxiredoxin Q/BCP